VVIESKRGTKREVYPEPSMMDLVGVGKMEPEK
jgi:hypothetical protein